MRILITAGGTREYVDPVRYLSNASSGRMGYALARAALKAGHEVTLISAPTALKPPTGVEIIRIESAAEMFAAVKEHFPKCDCLIMAAAVADFTPVRRSRTKIKTDGGLKPTLQLNLKPTPDILKWAARHKAAGQFIVGFALEDRNLRANAEKKLGDKRLDMIIANAPAAIGAESSTLHVKAVGSDWIEIAGAQKARSAARIVRLVTKLARAR